MTIMTSTRSTGQVGAGDRVAFWEQENARDIVGLSCSTLRPEGLVAELTHLDLAGIGLTEVTGNAHLIDRSAATVAASPKESVFVSLLTEGQGFFQHASGGFPVMAGEAVVYRTAQPYLFGFHRDMRQLIIDVPAELLRAEIGTEVPATPFLLPAAGNGYGAGAESLALLGRRLLSAGTWDAGLRTELISLALGVISPRQGGAALLLAGARKYVAEHLNEPGLGAESVAAALGVSARHLNRAFAAEDSTVTRHIQGARLAAAHAELASGAPGTIADLAARWGFSSQAHFTRAFGRHYGYTPSGARERQGAV